MQLKFSIMSEPPPKNICCGVDSIDQLIQNSYELTLFKQASAYNILIEDTLVGSCMTRIVSLVDENADYYNTDQCFTAWEISYIAIDKSYQGKNIGTTALKHMVRHIINQVQDNALPIRYLILDAFPGLEKFYSDAGFAPYPKVADPRFPGTIPMRLDLIDSKQVNAYTETQY